ncbi:uncharacterized protein [Macrobrachium rosenbergii]|uniref:uncharacterized protein n=1 Tax=Macrobrachium rosenbergii TaxID=79674 RepID=UPI0034D74BAD
MTGLVSPLAPVLLVLLGACFCAAEVCHLTDPIQRQECSSVYMMHGAASQIRTSVLQQLCEAGHRHVLLKGASPSQYQTLPLTSPRRAEQFSVIYIHRDDFSDKVNWKSGDAPDIMCNDNWFIDEEVKLTNGYHWYTHGLPIWPMVNQTVVPKKQGLLSRKKKIDWPNYAIGTPFYLVPFEIYNSRDPNVAIQKRFQNDFAATALAHEQNVLVNQAGFQGKVTDLYRTLFLDQAGYARKDINADFESYANWLQPLVQASLQPMLESFLQSQTPKKGQAAICPDELYVYFHKIPCTASSTCLVLNEFQLILKLASCPDTSVVVGYGTQSEIVEEIIPTKTLRKSESAPSPQVDTGRGTGFQMRSLASSNKGGFQILGLMLVLLTCLQVLV